MSRLNLVKGLGPVLQMAEGWTVDLPENVYEQLNERTDPTWPTHWFVPRLTGSGAIPGCVFGHGQLGRQSRRAVSYGHMGADLIALAAMLRIPVAMHNVAEEQIFRPSTWSAFGALDPQGADYRACAALARCTAGIDQAFQSGREGDDSSLPRFSGGDREGRSTGQKGERARCESMGLCGGYLENGHQKKWLTTFRQRTGRVFYRRGTH